MSEEVWHTMKVDDVLQALRSNEKGLSEEEVKRRLEEFGPNELREEKRVTALSIFFGQFKSILIVILIIAALVSGFLLNEVLDMYLISVIVVMNAALGFVQEYRAEKAMEALKRMITPVAKVVREGKELMKPSKELVPGDIIPLDGGDRVSADARLIEIVHLRTDEAPLTGESVPVTKKMVCLKKSTPVTDRVNMVFMGTHVVYGRGKAVVVATGMNTEFGKIAGIMQAVEEKPSPLKVKVEHLGRQLGLISLLGCVGTVLVGLIMWRPFVDMFLVGVGLAVSAIPEGLPAVLTVTLSLGAARMARNKAVVRKLASVETLGCATVICSDKTGTLTRNEMTVRELYVNGQTIHVTGVGYEPKGEFLKDKSINPQSDDHISLLLRIGCLCNNAKLEIDQKGWYVIGDPTEGALVTVAVKARIQQDEIRGQYPRIDEILFDSERKRMGTIHTTPSGEKIAYVKGAPEIVLGLCSHLHEHGRVRTMTDNDRKRVLMTTQNMASRALRVLAMTYRKLPNMLQNFTVENVETQLTFVGLVGMIDPARKEVSEAIKQCKQAGIRSVMITGDHRLTAIAVAKEIGMLEGDDPKVLTGAELDELSDEEFKKVVEEVVVYARSSPEHKVRITRALREKGQIIAMTGDGVNDAPAVKTADIGVAMGIKGTDVTKEASDMILEDDNFATIVTAVEEGRHIYDNIRKYMRLMISTNFDEILELSACVLLGWPLTLLPIHILWINLITDGLPAVALAVDPKDPEVMKRPPRDPKKGVLHGLWLFVFVAAVLDVISDLIPFGWIYQTTGNVARAQTVAFTIVCIFEFWMVFNCRSETHSIFRLGWRGFTANKFLLISVAVGLLLQIAIIYVPFFNPIFHTVPLNIFDLVVVTVFSSLGLLTLPEILISQR